MSLLSGLLILCLCIQIGSPALSQDDALSNAPAGITITNAKWETFFNVSSDTGTPTGTGSEPNPNRLPVPTQGTTSTMVRTQLYAYSIDLRNNGSKAIKALAWDFIFRDPASGSELGRKSFANLQQIKTNQKKSLRFTTR